MHLIGSTNLFHAGESVVLIFPFLFSLGNLCIPICFGNKFSVRKLWWSLDHFQTILFGLLVFVLQHGQSELNFLHRMISGVTCCIHEVLEGPILHHWAPTLLKVWKRMGSFWSCFCNSEMWFLTLRSDTSQANKSKLHKTKSLFGLFDKVILPPKRQKGGCKLMMMCNSKCEEKTMLVGTISTHIISLMYGTCWHQVLLCSQSCFFGDADGFNGQSILALQSSWVCAPSPF